MPMSTQETNDQLEEMYKDIAPKESDTTSVAPWLLQDYQTHKERLIKGIIVLSEKHSILTTPIQLPKILKFTDTKSLVS